MKKLVYALASILLVLSVLAIHCSKKEEDDKSAGLSITKDNGIKVLTMYMTSVSRAMSSMLGMGISIPAVPGKKMVHDPSMAEIFSALPLERLYKPILDTTIIIENDSQYMSIKVNETSKLDLTIIYKATQDTLNLTATIAIYDAANQLISISDTSSKEIKKVVMIYTMISSTFEPLYGRIKQESDGNYTILFQQENVYQLDGTGNQATTLPTEYYKLKTTCYQLVIDNSDENSETTYPKSGYIKLESSDGTYIKMIFDGTQYAKLEIYDGKNTYNYTMNLETGEIPTL